MKKVFIHEQALISPKAKIGEDSRVWAFTNIQDDVVIGRGCNICDGCFIERGARIGNNVTLKNGVAVFEGVVLEDDVFCGVHVAFVNDRYPRSRTPDWKLEGILIKKGATLGSNAVIMCGITVGEYAMVGAGSVVTKDVPAQGLVLGNPARLQGYVCVCGLKLDSHLKCTCGKTYAINRYGIHLQ